MAASAWKSVIGGPRLLSLPLKGAGRYGSFCSLRRDSIFWKRTERILQRRDRAKEEMISGGDVPGPGLPTAWIQPTQQFQGRAGRGALVATRGLKGPTKA